MQENSINVAVIGCGRIAGHHCRSITDTPGIKLVAVCDLDIARAIEYQKQFDVKAYDNYHTMLQENKIDVVAIITPTGMHYEHAIEIISRYKKHIIVEKPTFLRPSQLIEIYVAANNLGLKIFPVFQNRYNKAVCRVIAGLKNGELGRIRTVAVRVRWNRPQRYYDMAPWRGTYALDGGSLANQGIHHIDLMRLMGGEVKRVCALNRTLGADIEVEDSAVAIIDFNNGAIGSLEITTAARPIDYEASISLVCENGLAQIGGIAVNELQIYTPDASACSEYSEDFSGNVYGYGHAKFYKELVSDLSMRYQFSICEQDVLETIRFLNALYISDENNNWVELRECGDSKRLGKPDEKLSQLYRTSYSN
ncbi:MviM Predicted dehydrogenases and related proteins [Burkholderiaceae bacterium]